MGMPPLTPEDFERYRKHIEEVEAAIKSRQEMLEALGIKPIPEEKYRKYCIKDVKQCDKCGHFLWHHPIGAIRIGDNWYDFLDLETTILENLEKINKFNQSH